MTSFVKPLGLPPIYTTPWDLYAQTCPPNMQRYYAIVEQEEDDVRIVKAQETIEVADEWLNGCSNRPPSDTFTSQVMWLLDRGSPERWIEIGVRKLCFDGNSIVFPYYSYGVRTAGVGAGAPVRFQGLPTISAATRVDVSMEDLGQIQGELAHKWKFQIDIDGTKYAGTLQVSHLFVPNIIQVGGEASSDLHDMGVSGHLAARYVVDTGSSLVLYYLNAKNPDIFQDSPRYNIVSGAGGFNENSYYQTFSNIHVGNPSPTEVPAEFNMCLGE